MRLEPLYRVRFTYSGSWGADLAEPDSAEGRFFFLVADSRSENSEVLAARQLVARLAEHENN